MIPIIITDKHEYVCNACTIGRTYENEAEELQITLPEDLKNNWVYLDFEKPDGVKFKTPKLEETDGMIKYKVGGALLDKKGFLKVEVIIQNSQGLVWKSEQKSYAIHQAINATQYIADNNPDFIAQAQELLNEAETMDVDIETTERGDEVVITRKDGTKKRSVISGGGGTYNHSRLNNLDYENSGHTGFQKSINDLDTIRSGARLGATSVQDNEYVHTDNNYTDEDKEKVKSIGTTPDTLYANGADYAEVGTWFDGNPNNEDRLYRFVTLKADGRQIALANSNSQILGVTNNKAAFVGNAKNYSKEDLSKSIVGIIGVVPVKTNDTTIEAGDRVMSDDNGYAIKSSNNLGYRVLEVLQEGLLEIVVSVNTDMIQRIKNDMEEKQNKLIPGENITIENNVISATGGSEVGSVESVNGKTGKVILNANDVGALPDTTEIPTKTSQLTNDSGFIDNTYHDSSKQDTIDSGNKLNSDLVDDSNSTNKFVTSQEKESWNNKSDFDGDFNSLENKPTKVSEFENDSEYLTLETLPIYDGGVE